MVVEPPLPQLARRLLDHLGKLRRELTEAAVRSRGRELLQAEGANEACRQTLAPDIADGEDGEGSLGLCAPVAVGRNLDRAEGIALDPGCHRRQHASSSPPQSALTPAALMTGNQRSTSAWM